MNTYINGFPRVGKLRELKFATEKYWKKDLSVDELENVARELRLSHWSLQRDSGVDYIPSNDFSFYDNLLDAALLFNLVPTEYRDLGLSQLDTYFAMARGYQGDHGDVKALGMKKWFNTNYHYMEPEIYDDTIISLVGTKPFDEYLEAKNHGIETVPTIVGPFTLLKLCKFMGKSSKDSVSSLVKAYCKYIEKLETLGAKWLSLQEPSLVKDLSKEDIALFTSIYESLLQSKGGAKIRLDTYFGDLRDCYQAVVSLDFDGIALDFIEGRKNLSLVQENRFPKDKLLFAGVVNGKNIWRNNYDKTLEILDALSSHNIVIGTSCSLLHVPYALENEEKLEEKYRAHFSFAKEKLGELQDIKNLYEGNSEKLLIENRQLFKNRVDVINEDVQARLSKLTDDYFVRHPKFEEREIIQRQSLKLPSLPTTTIGSMPQTKDVKKNRAQYKKGEKSYDEYVAFNKTCIAKTIEQQEKIGLDVLVHGEYERNDMVEYFGENLDGFLFTEKAWVQSYGTRCVKPPIIWGDISREKPFTVPYSTYAQSLTKKYVKGMLTGPVTILNWSFPREDISLQESAYQVALAIRDEVLDLEKNGIKIIQVDEAALREKLPLRKSDWKKEYLDWAIPAFRLVHSGLSQETQLHTHMCYSEFSDIIKEIDNMDADVITFESARSDLSIVKTLEKVGFKTQVGPGVYDIHSPRIPGVEEIETIIDQLLQSIPKEKLWINPDCGLKTRGEKETLGSLINLVQAAKNKR